MDTQVLQRWAALPHSNVPRLDELHVNARRKLDDTIEAAENSHWGLPLDMTATVALAKAYAEAELARDELSRKLAGAQMKIGRLEKKIAELPEQA